MSRYGNGVASINNVRTRNSAAPTRLKSIKMRLFGAAVVMAVIPFAAESADDIKYPVGYRNWFHVNTLVVDKASPLFDTLGGMHNVYVNATALAALKKGGPYPDKSVFVSDVHDFTVTDGSYV